MVSRMSKSASSTAASSSVAKALAKNFRSARAASERQSALLRATSCQSSSMAILVTVISCSAFEVAKFYTERYARGSSGGSSRQGSRPNAGSPLVFGHAQSETTASGGKFFQAFSKLFANFRVFSASFSKLSFGGFGGFQRLRGQKIWRAPFSVFSKFFVPTGDGIFRKGGAPAPIVGADEAEVLICQTAQAHPTTRCEKQKEIFRRFRSFFRFVFRFMLFERRRPPLPLRPALFLGWSPRNCGHAGMARGMSKSSVMALGEGLRSRRRHCARSR